MNEENQSKAKLKSIVRWLYREIRKEEQRRVLYNCTLLMEQYRELKAHVERAVSEISEIEKPSFYESGTSLKSVRQSKCETLMLLYNIDRAIDELREETKANGTAYKFDAFYLHYVEGYTYERVCEKLNCGKNSPAKWCKDMTRIMAVKLFGLNGIEFR